MQEELKLNCGRNFQEGGLRIRTHAGVADKGSKYTQNINLETFRQYFYWHSLLLPMKQLNNTINLVIQCAIFFFILLIKNR